MSSECFTQHRAGIKHLSWMMCPGPEGAGLLPGSGRQAFVSRCLGLIQLCLGLASKPTVLLSFSGKALRRGWGSLLPALLPGPC